MVLLDYKSFMVGCGLLRYEPGQMDVKGSRVSARHGRYTHVLVGSKLTIVVLRTTQMSMGMMLVLAQIGKFLARVGITLWR